MDTDTDTDTATLLRSADALAAEGGTLDAIRLLTEANDRERRAELERRVLVLRHEAQKDLDPSAGPSTWPRETEDLFPGETGLPEITADRLDAPVLNSAIRHHGALIVRGLIDPSWVEVLAQDVATLAELYESAREHNTEPDPEWFHWFDPDNGALALSRRFVLEERTTVLAADSPRVFHDLINAYRASGVVDVIAAQLGEWPALSVLKTALRCTPPDVLPVWHQDGSFLDPTFRMRTVNVWMALTECGVDAPGLDIVAQPLTDVLSAAEADADPEIGLAANFRLFDETAEGRTVRPVFQPGDAALFDQFTLHRTGADASMTKERLAIEGWFFAPSVYPDEQIFLAI